MTYIGDSINVVLAGLVVLSVLGTAGATVFYQHATTDLRAENRELADQNAALRDELADARGQLNQTRERLERKNATIESLRRDIEAKNRDIETLTKRIEELEAQQNDSSSALVAPDAPATIDPADVTQSETAGVT